MLILRVVGTLCATGLACNAASRPLAAGPRSTVWITAAAWAAVVAAMWV